MDKDELGRQGEALAAAFLTERGYRVMARNFRVQGAEIDIVAEQSGTIVFVEVKTRRTGRYGSPAQAVGIRKQRKIIFAARCFLRQNNREDCFCRFDVIEVYAASGWQLRHLPGAFET